MPPLMIATTSTVTAAPTSIDVPPQYGIDKICRDHATFRSSRDYDTGTVAWNKDRNEQISGCIRQSQVTYDELKSTWLRYSPSARRTCIDEIAGSDDPYSLNGYYRLYRCLKDYDSNSPVTTRFNP
jgi:hypothetical protein